MKEHPTEEQILRILKEAEPGKPLPDVLRTHGIASGTYFRWKARYGGLEPSQFQRLRQLERENNELKKVGANLTLDVRMLKDVNSKNW